MADCGLLVCDLAMKLVSAEAMKLVLYGTVSDLSLVVV